MIPNQNNDRNNLKVINKTNTSENIHIRAVNSASSKDSSVHSELFKFNDVDTAVLNTPDQVIKLKNL